MKMATGSGKTVVMAMLIAWQALNKLDNRQDARFSDAFLIVTPGITIRDRLRVLLPSDPDNYYRALDILPADLRERLGQARIGRPTRHIPAARRSSPLVTFRCSATRKTDGGRRGRTRCWLTRRSSNPK